MALYQINVRIDEEIRQWLDLKPRTFSLSELVRSLLHSEMEKQEGIRNDSHQTTTC
jgi:hypothetical protein